LCDRNQFIQNFTEVTNQLWTLQMQHSKNVDRKNPNAQYKFVKLLQFTNLGLVWLAEERSCPSRLVVAKLSLFEDVGKSGHDDPIREARMQRQFGEMNIFPRVYATFGDDESSRNDSLFHWNVMQFCEGGDLWTYVKRSPVAVEQRNVVLSYFRDAMLLVQRLHEAGYAHMDLKPENILFAKEQGMWVVKLCDLGVCREIVNDATEVLGTKRYICPYVYVCRSKRMAYDQCKADCWSLSRSMLVFFLRQTVFDAPDDSNSFFRRIFYRGEFAALMREYKLEHYMPPALIDCLGQALCPAASRPCIKDMLAHPCFQNADAAMEQRMLAHPI
jgi:serine/threonine protein kinase